MSHFVIINFIYFRRYYCPIQPPSKHHYKLPYKILITCLYLWPLPLLYEPCEGYFITTVIISTSDRSTVSQACIPTRIPKQVLHHTSSALPRMVSSLYVSWALNPLPHPHLQMASWIKFFHIKTFLDIILITIFECKSLKPVNNGLIFFSFFLIYTNRMFQSTWKL